MLAYGTLAAIATLAAMLVILKSGRLRLYRELAALQTRIIEHAPAPMIASAGGSPGFSDLLARAPEFLPPATLAALRAEIETLVDTERSYLPAHKKGGTVAYETLCRQAPAVIRLYLDRELIAYLSRVTGIALQPTPLNDQSSCSVLFYERPGDHIGWHFDHNFYRGRHFTVLISIVNTGKQEDGLSAARLIAMQRGDEIVVPTPPNTLVVFEGAKVRHRVTPIAEGERRVMLSMTYCADPRSSLAQGVQRRIKDTAFFGIRALWT